jgi:hypothetical protein
MDDLSPKSMPPGTYCVTFVSGMDIIPIAPSNVSGDMIMAAVPTGISGQAYVFLTSDNSGNITGCFCSRGYVIFGLGKSSC